MLTQATSGAELIRQIAPGWRWTWSTEKPAEVRAAPAVPGLPDAQRTSVDPP